MFPKKRRDGLTRHAVAIGFAGSAIAVIASAIVKTSRRRRYTLDGKSVVITGGSRGLGLALARECLSRGAQVSLVARNLEELERARHMLIDSGSSEDRISLVPCDISDPGATKLALEQLALRVGRLDVLINNAGVIHVGPMEDQDLDAYRESMNINLFGAVQTVYAVLPEMLKRGKGHIVNVASIGGLVAVPHLLPYSASKFALVGFSRGLSAELSAKGIKVLTVCPWLIRTGSHLKAKFTGKAASEYQWFSAGATLPLVAMSAETTAQMIADAIENGESEIHLSLWSHLAVYFATRAPELTNGVLSIVNRILPGATSQDQAPADGLIFENNSPKFLQALGRSAASQWNQ